MPTSDMIRGITSNESSEDLPTNTPRGKKTVVTTKATDPPQIVVTTDYHESGNHQLVLVGINARDRPGLLLDISKGLLRLELQLRHTEAAVIGERSISIWRCEFLGTQLPDVEEIWSVLNVSRYCHHPLFAFRMNAFWFLTNRWRHFIAGSFGSREWHFSGKDAWHQGHSCNSTKGVTFDRKYSC